jgi:hypothetical protein
MGPTRSLSSTDYRRSETIEIATHCTNMTITGAVMGEGAGLLTVVVILAEAMALYVGYGALEEVVAPFVFEQLRKRSEYA